MIKFNSKGDCLISKILNQKLTVDARQSFKKFGIKMPQKSCSYDVIEIGHNYKPEEVKTTITTFKDKAGKIIQRNIEEKSGNEVITTQKNYKDETTYVADPIDPDSDDLFRVLKRTISSITKENGKFSRRSRQINALATTPEGKPVVTISKVESYPMGFYNAEFEKQSLYQYTKDGKKGYTIDNYSRSSKTGPLIDNILDDTYSFENMQDLSNDRFLPIHLYSDKEFRRMAPFVASTHEGSFKKYVHWYNESQAHQNANGYYDGEVHLNRKKLNSKMKIIKTSAHEFEHEYQHNIIHDKLELDNLLKMKAEGKKEPSLEKRIQWLQSRVEHNVALKHIEAQKAYVAPEEDFEKYWTNFKKIQARKAGRQAQTEYEESYNRLRNEFPYAADGQIGPTLREEGEDVTGLLNILEEIGDKKLDS